MSFTADVKKKVIGNFSRHEKDTGSTEVQIALMSERIKNLTEHFKNYPKDNNSKRGLLRLIGRRKRLLRYLEKTDPLKYEEITKKLGI
ncbi:MAG: 30S ribosomal protein S15 [Brevinematales bacterium]|nr:30S ribosomal protein S15 [Brevinematales bacterium]